MFSSAYLRQLRREERRSLWGRLVPEPLRALRRGWLYQRAFPKAWVSPEAVASLQASIGEGCLVRRGCHIGETVHMHRFSTLGDGCQLRGSGQITIGAFCSIAPEVVILSENHALQYLTTFPLELYRDGSNRQYQEFTAEDVEIGADVWIGQRVVILPGARIATGCVIAAGSVVPRGEYPPYSILAGVPARLVKKRLDETSRQALLRSRWWEQSPHRIFAELFDDLHARDAAETRHFSRVRGELGQVSRGPSTTGDED